MLSQVGLLASSKSAMKTLAPELSALMTILRSVGPGDLDATVEQVLGRAATRPVAGPDVGRLGEEVRRSPASSRACRVATAGEQLLDPRPERAGEVGDERQRLAA